ncbi:MAG: DUF4241 domain-containing protein [Alphaproteobacteria bacterium]|nr:DUF4241 domain-containing protein [Alphaproteobacteria bacterium]MCB9692343.1 DUF4241 domain-containing protein [Alphaproteobacteria bacterium]
MHERTDFDLAFSANGAVEGSWDEIWSVRVEEAGHLDLVGGRIVVGDPLTGGLSDGPLARAVPPGRYPVDLSVVRRPPDSGGVADERVAAARVRFRSTVNTSWPANGREISRL